MMTRGRGGVWIPPKSNDVIYEQPLMNHITQLGNKVQILTEEGEQVPSTMIMMMAMMVTMVMVMVILLKRWNRTKLLSSL